ncbi:reverse transcriptase-like protein [Planococcus sp. ISL-110]|uniref:reverse transcriptase-like protein n=1 Tax=Planococcus sp. ISL-110 TaxID=2819167 RepID=UPI001BEB6447|nr:reverse transcriptase-like protein [Planococcus sp. ISL-110]MBT2569682.1 reverse transcriptase-like protein [Planococcus sp. ISL-110]
MEIRIEWTYKIPKGPETNFFSEEMPAAMALVIAEDLERNGRSKNLHFVDRFDSSWTIKEMKVYLKGIETEPHNVIVYFDGGYERLTRSAGLGCVIYYEQNGKSYRLRTNAIVDRLSSNNESEYAALYFCLQELEYLKVHHLPVRFIGDSRIVINGMADEWPAIEEQLVSWTGRIEEKIVELGIRPEYELIPRKANAEADKLATQALNGIRIAATSEIIA